MKIVRNLLLRKRVLERDQGSCIQCGKYDPHWEADHILARWSGGKDELVMTISELVSRIESAREGSPELRMAIAEALGWVLVRPRQNEYCWRLPDGSTCYRLPAWDQSLDVAMQLVPEAGEFPDVARHYAPQITWLHDGRAKCNIHRSGHGIVASTECATPALALVSAALKARAS